PRCDGIIATTDPRQAPSWLTELSARLPPELADLNSLHRLEQARDVVDAVDRVDLRRRNRQLGDELAVVVDPEVGGIGRRVDVGRHTWAVVARRSHLARSEEIEVSVVAAHDER